MLKASDIPSSLQYQQLHELLDLGLRYEQASLEIIDIFSTLSALELLGFFINVVFFIGSAHKQLWYAVMFMFHVVRGFVGFALSRIFPVSHEVF